MRARRLWHRLLRGPRLWVLLLAWVGLVLAVELVHYVMFLSVGVTAYRFETALVISALVALILAGLVAAYFYLNIRAIRTHLFEGNYEDAYDVARRHAGILLGIDFERALHRLLEFDRCRAGRVAATTRLVGRLMRETPLMMLLGDLDAGQIRFSLALCQLFDIKDNRFSADSILLQPDNRDFARLWHDAARGERTAVEATLTLRLPVRQLARRLHIRLLAVQDDAGAIAYVLGLAELPEGEPRTPAQPSEEIQL